MSDMIRPLATAFIAASCLAAIASPAAAGSYDGSWSVVAVTRSGSCEGPFSYPIVIRDGQVDDAGGNGIDASGRAAPDGSISGTITKGLANVSVSGRLRGARGSGRWTLTGLSACSGTWTAHRTTG